MPNLPNVAITNFQNIYENRYLPAQEDRPIGRTYCGAQVILSDGNARDIWYLIEEGQGYAGRSATMSSSASPASTAGTSTTAAAGFFADRCEMPRRALLVFVAGVLLLGCSQEAEKPPAADAKLPTPIAQPAQPDAPAAPAASSLPIGEGFDFYVLSLSWSPSYCEAEGEEANRQQCGIARPYAFVVHGLWPQFERGFPESCRTDEPDVSNATLRTLYDIMPSAGLIRHQWRKHGSCSRARPGRLFCRPARRPRDGEHTLRVPASRGLSHGRP